MSTRSGSLLLLLLLAGDLAFVAIHLVYLNTSIINDALYSIERDRGYAEIYQYVKFFWILALLAYLVLTQKVFGYLAWMLVFSYFLLDDAIELHERFGDFFEIRFVFEPPFNLRLQDVGELLFSAASGVLLAGSLLWAWLSGSRHFRRITLDLLLLTALLAICGVAIDMLHIAVQGGDFLRHSFGLIEDGGEMLTVSAMVWYIFLLALRYNAAEAYLYEGFTRRASASHSEPRRLS